MPAALFGAKRNMFARFQLEMVPPRPRPQLVFNKVLPEGYAEAFNYDLVRTIGGTISLSERDIRKEALADLDFLSGNQWGMSSPSDTQP